MVELGRPWSFDGAGLEIFEAGHVIRVLLADFSEKASPAHVLTRPKMYRRSFQKSKLRSQARLLSLKMIDYRRKAQDMRDVQILVALLIVLLSVLKA
jgi:hypothetical protein